MGKVFTGTPLEQFVCDMTKKGISRPTDIHSLLESNGFKKVTTQAIVQIQQRFGLKKRSTAKGRPKKA